MQALVCSIPLALVFVLFTPSVGERERGSGSSI